MQFEKAVQYILDKQSKVLSPDLCYHNIDHIKDVYEAARQIGTAEGVTAHELQLLLTAASYHDAGYLKQAKAHEEESCRIARTVLPEFEYTPEDIERICGMIMATRLPQTPHNHLEQILADADLDYLGRDDFFTTGQQLFAELQNFGNIGSENDWNAMQVKFVESHQYFTQTSIQQRQAKKDENLAAVKSKIK
ncbi:HD domain-containing protein [Mucilaginibacter lacusdianchii]|uniref:HD domain-containing protein n=1 Tax=Mucilaginibacter lacusdianchii TaxID=2684211 RepID=UPI00131BE616|nr:HD domain-containing protein [Mucilaginibacter sp. JXJ CY 39]